MGARRTGVSKPSCSKAASAYGTPPLNVKGGRPLLRPPPERKTPMPGRIFVTALRPVQQRRPGAEQQALDPNFPLAAHCNTACNDKIAHLPAGFAGVFVVEESTYTANGKTHASPHLFLFTEEGDGIRLTSYEIPAGYDKDTFTYAAMGQVEYADLVPSKSSRRRSTGVRATPGWAAAQAGSPRCSSSHCGSGSPPTGSKSARQWSLTANGPSGLTSPLLYRRID